MIIKTLFILVAPVIFYLINKLLAQVNFLVEDVNKSNHKRIFSIKNKKIQSGGLFLLFSFLLFFFNENIYLSISLTLIFILGVLSDIDYVSSPIIRFLFQLLVITFLVISTQIFVENTRIEILDNFLENKNFKFIFTTSCFLVLINGCNFIDGANNILIGYFLIVSVCILIVTNYLQINLDLYYLIITLLILLIFNFFSKIIMGDSGAYLVGLLFGYLAINLSNNNISISPIYVLNLLWYPAFENLFSILRKIKKKISASMADNDHLHHLIYRKLSKMLKKNKFSNSLTGIIINFFNLIGLTISSIVHNHSFYLSVILIFNITVYTSVYYSLSRKRY
tara:strand:+ start:66 stop:1076 length:1011 start_codon:yes stop_codon:yes gene_type:complete